MRILLPLVILGLATTAPAGTVVSTGIFEVNPDTLDQFALEVSCRVTNASSKGVVVDSVRFLDENGTEYVQNEAKSNCTYPNPILPGLTCIHGLDKFELPATGFIRCEVDAKGSAKALRVTMEIVNLNLNNPSDFPPNFRSDVGR